MEDYLFNRLKFYISLVFARLAYTFLKITKLSSGTAFIGYLVLKICPDFLVFANECISKRKINVTGTNGKTTTSGLISHLIKNSGHRIVNNALGANMLTGIVNALSITLNPFIKAEYSIIETDEAYLEKVYEKADGDYLLVTNLFTDQSDRYGEVSVTKKLIQNGIDEKENVTLLLNADDPIVAGLQAKNRVYFGVDEIIYKNGQEHRLPNEDVNCPCGEILSYSKKFYAQMGHYKCQCGYKRPSVKYNGKITLFNEHSEIEINGAVYYVPLIGLFNAYNALGAISLALELGIENIEQNLKTFKVAFGRSETKILNGHRTLIQLIKNTVGANEVLKSVDLNSNILIMINDEYADGRDVSWFWDTEFERLKDAKNEIVVSGSRANDIALRLKYADCKDIKIIPNVTEAIDYTGRRADGNITILPSYTVLLTLDKMKNFKKI